MFEIFHYKILGEQCARQYTNIENCSKICFTLYITTFKELLKVFFTGIVSFNISVLR